MPVDFHPRTERFRLTLGVTPGYFHRNELAGADDLAARVALLWQTLMEAEAQVHGVHAPAVVTAGLVVYPRDRGCPQGGEHVVVVAGTRNPRFLPDARVWREVVYRVAAELKRHLEQVTAYLEFDEGVALAYLMD